MTGIALILILGLWVAAVAWAVSRMARLISASWWKPVALAVVTLSLVALPFLDEIVGRHQFNALCAQSATLQIHVPEAKGRVARYIGGPVNERVEGTAIPIHHTRLRYVDSSSNEVLVSFNRYVAKGGFLITALGISENNSPLLIGRPTCSPELTRGEMASKTLGFTVIN